MADKKKPAHKIRSGNITATIWKNTSDSNKSSWYTVNLPRSYKDTADGEWKETDSYAVDDLPNLSKLADMAHTWIATQPDDKKAG
jgi:hypothetical protein